MSDKRELGKDHILIYRTDNGWELRLDIAPTFKNRELEMPGQNSFKSFEQLVDHIKESIKTN